MTNDELQEQFDRCVKWGDADQWDLLGLAYFQRGYALNAGVCFRRADECRTGIEVVGIPSTIRVRVRNLVTTKERDIALGDITGLVQEN